MIAPTVYVLCATTSLTCAVLLFRAYRVSEFSLLFWSGVCFAALALNNILLFIDLVIVPDINLTFWRNITALFGVSVLLVSLIWDTL